MEHYRTEDSEITRLKGSAELNAVMYACSVVQDAPKSEFSNEAKEQALRIGNEAGRIEGSFDLEPGQVVLDLDKEDFTLLASASKYFLEARRAKKLRTGSSENLLAAAKIFADSDTADDTNV